MLGAATLGGLLMSGLGAYHATEALGNTMSNVKTQLGPWRESIDNYKTMSDDYLDIGSNVNQNLRTDIRQNALDFAASNTEVFRRNMSSGGIGGMSGLANQGVNNMYNQALANSEDSFNSAFAQNQKFGGSLLDSYVKNLRGYSENLAQGQIQVDSAKANIYGQMGMGLGEGMLSFGMEGNPGGLEWV